MSEEQKQPEVHNVIYDISQGIVATGSRSAETSDYDFIINLLLSLLWKNFQNRSISGKVTGQKADYLSAVCAGTLSCWKTKNLTYSKQKLL